LFTAIVYVNRSLVITAIFTILKNQKQRICLKCCVSNHISCVEIFKNNRIWGKSTYWFCITI